MYLYLLFDDHVTCNLESSIFNIKNNSFSFSKSVFTSSFFYKSLTPAGVVPTSNAHLATNMQALTRFGEQNIPYVYTIPQAWQSIMGNFQAVMLAFKLPYLTMWSMKWLQIACLYHLGLQVLASHIVIPPLLEIGSAYTCMHSLYIIEVKDEGHQDKLLQHCFKQGIRMDVHFPIACHLQQNQPFTCAYGTFPITKKAARCMLSLPMYPHMTEQQVNYVCKMLMDLFGMH